MSKRRPDVKAGQKVARLTLIVEYDNVPDRIDVDEVVEKARGLGTIVTADLEYVKPCKVDLR